MERVSCPHCRYANKPGELCCNLCGAVLPQAAPEPGAGLPQPFLANGTDYEPPAETPLSRAATPAPAPTPTPAPEPSPELEPEVEAGPLGVRRLRHAQLRVTQRLQRLANVQEETLPVLQAQIEAEREETRLKTELIQANKALSQKRSTLQEREKAVRSLRKAVAAAEYDLVRQGQELERQEREQEELEGLLVEVRSGVTPRIRELQTQCVRLEEKLAMAITKLRERDSVIHWLVCDPPEPVDQDAMALEQQVAELPESPLEALEAEDLVHWFTHRGAEDVAAE